MKKKITMQSRMRNNFQEREEGGGDGRFPAGKNRDRKVGEVGREMDDKKLSEIEKKEKAKKFARGKVT